MGEARFAVQNYSLEDEANRYTLGSSMDVWVGKGGKFRISSSDDFWGGGSLIVSDGSSVMTDAMSDDRAVSIEKAGKSLHEFSSGEPLLYFLEGPAAFDKVVDKDKPVRFVSTTGPQKAIEMTLKGMGRVVVYYLAGSEFPLPSKIESFQGPWWSGGEEWPQATSREIIRLVQIGKLDPKAFSVDAPKGRNVIDQRRKS